MMEFPAPLPDEVLKIQDGMYLYHGLYLRFNRMELHAKWTAHFHKADSVDDKIDSGATIRDLVHYINMLYWDLGAGCQVDGFCDPDE
jgi:hypothetical protein